MAKSHPNADRFNHLQGKTRWGLCDVCIWPYPENVLKMQEGVVVCPDHYESGGREQSRQRERSMGAVRAARIEAINRTPKYPSSDGIVASGSGVITPFVRGFSPKPLPLVAGGGTVVLTLDGRYLTSTVLTSCESNDAGITLTIDSFPDTDSCLINAAASGAVAVGEYDIFVNFDTGLRAIFRKGISVS